MSEQLLATFQHFSNNGQLTVTLNGEPKPIFEAIDTIAKTQLTVLRAIQAANAHTRSADVVRA